MNEHVISIAASFPGTYSEHAVQMQAATRAREEAISLAHQLVQLVKLIQRHRGTTMATLAGDGPFQLQISALEAELERRLVYIQVFIANRPLLPEQDQENLHNAWMTLSRGWHDDNVIDNFELHCHVLDQLLGMLAALVRQLEQPVSVAIDGATVTAEDAQKVLRQRALLDFVAVQVPQVAEQIARIRGLATYAVSLKSCSQQHQLKLRFCIKRVRELSRSLGQAAAKLSNLLNKTVSPLGQLKTYEIKLTFLLNQVESEVLAKRVVQANGLQLFSLATDIIDAYLQVVDEGLTLVGRWHLEDLNDWFRRR